MHSIATRNEFLRLRIAGLSFARIARQLGVSKPTLIAWNRASRPQLDSGHAEAQEHLQDEITTANPQPFNQKSKIKNAKIKNAKSEVTTF